MNNSPRTWLSAAAASLALLFASSVQAQERRTDANEQLEATLRQIDAATRDARTQASQDGERRLANRMRIFDNKVLSLRGRIEDHRLSDDGVRRDFKALNDDSRKIERDIVSDRRAAPETADRWRRVVRLVDDLDRDYQAAMNPELMPRGTAGRDRDWDRDHPIDRGRQDTDRYGQYGDYGSAPAGVSQLAADLDGRAHHASEIAERMGDPDDYAQLARCADHVSTFARSVSRLSDESVRERARGLLGEARDVQRSLTRQNAGPELVAEWNGVIDSLQQLAGTRDDDRR